MEDTRQTNQNIQISESVDADYEYKHWKREMFLRRKLDPVIDKLILSKGRGALWDVVDEIMRYLWTYKRDYMVDLIEDVKRDRELVLNQYGSSKGKSFRKLGSMPEELEILISRAYMEEIDARSSKFRREFFKRYPAFRIAEKI